MHTRIQALSVRRRGRTFLSCNLCHCSLFLRDAAEKRAAAAEAAEAEAEAEVGFAGDKVAVQLQRSFPLASVVGMDDIKQALLLGAVSGSAAA